MTRLGWTVTVTLLTASVASGVYWILFGGGSLVYRVASLVIGLLYGAAFWGVVRLVLVAVAGISRAMPFVLVGFFFVSLGLVGASLGAGVASEGIADWRITPGVGFCLLQGGLGSILGVSTLKCRI